MKEKKKENGISENKVFSYFNSTRLPNKSSGKYQRIREEPLWFWTMQMCLKECEAFSLCSSINFHRKLFVCELNSHRTDGNISLINDQDYVYHEISHPVRKSYYIHKQCDNKSFHSRLDIHSLVKDIQSVLYLYEYDDSRLCNVFQLCER